MPHPGRRLPREPRPRPVANRTRSARSPSPAPPRRRRRPVRRRSPPRPPAARRRRRPPRRGRARDVDEPTVLGHVGFQPVREDLDPADPLDPRQVVGSADVDVVAMETEGAVRTRQPEGDAVRRDVVERDRRCGPVARTRQEPVEPAQNRIPVVGSSSTTPRVPSVRPSWSRALGPCGSRRPTLARLSRKAVALVREIAEVVGSRGCRADESCAPAINEVVRSRPAAIEESSRRAPVVSGPAIPCGAPFAEDPRP